MKSVSLFRFLFYCATDGLILGTEDWVIIDKVPAKIVDGETKSIITYKLTTVSSDKATEKLRTSPIGSQTLDSLRMEIEAKEEENRQKMYTLGKSYDALSGRIVTMTSKGKEGEKGSQPSTLELGEELKKDIFETVKKTPVVEQYEITEIISEDMGRKTPEAPIIKRRVSESLTPIKESDSQLASPIEEGQPKVPDADRGMKVIETVITGKVAGYPEYETITTEAPAWKDKKLSEWRYTRDQPFTIATAHYVTESSASKVVTSGDPILTIEKHELQTSPCFTTKPSSGDKFMDGSNIYSLLDSTRKPSEFIGEVTTTSQNWAQVAA
ncbi:uncharacterized protein PAF06_011846 [Gastrophryne carolinensis]